MPVCRGTFGQPRKCSHWVQFHTHTHTNHKSHLCHTRRNRKSRVLVVLEKVGQRKIFGTTTWSSEQAKPPRKKTTTIWCVVIHCDVPVLQGVHKLHYLSTILFERKFVFKCREVLCKTKTRWKLTAVNRLRYTTIVMWKLSFTIYLENFAGDFERGQNASCSHHLDVILFTKRIGQNDSFAPHTSQFASCNGNILKTVVIHEWIDRWNEREITINTKMHTNKIL